ncbi:MAG: hypothetical protein ACYCZY_02420 [Lacisediminihabitans sp.]
MHSIRRRYTVSVAVALVLLAGPALSGCSVQGLVHNVTGGQVDLGGKKVPADFPSEVPLVKGDVVLGASVGGNGAKVWNVTVKVSDASSFDAIKSQLEGAGFRGSGALGGSAADGGTGVFSSDKYGVLVVVAKDGSNGWVANYTVSNASK